MPALLRAYKLVGRWDETSKPYKAFKSADFGDRLLSLVAEARAAGVEPEQALREALRREEAAR